MKQEDLSYPKKTYGKHIMAAKSKKAVKNSRMVTQVIKVGKINNIKSDPVVRYNPDIVNSEYFNYSGCVNSYLRSSQSQKHLLTEPLFVTMARSAKKCVCGGNIICLIVKQYQDAACSNEDSVQPKLKLKTQNTILSNFVAEIFVCFPLCVAGK